MSAERPRSRTARQARAWAAAGVLTLLLLPAQGAAPAPSAASGSGGSAGSASGWIEVDYAALVDGRRLTHSGESIGMVLNQLRGRPYPRRGTNPDDATAHVLLDPLLEPYAYVLSDTLDTLDGGGARWVDVG